jgi:hypothetical protein
MRIDPRLVQMTLVPGTQQPAAGPAAGAVPVTDRSTLIAAFNAGFKMKDTNGGWFSQGRTAVPLLAGTASLVFRNNGTADVGIWGRDDTMDPRVNAVRQNRLLLIDNRRPNPLVATPYFLFVWGATIHKQEAVWRSGIGITKQGLLVYAAGRSLTVPQLTAALLAVGAIRAMELDINTQFVDAYTYTPSAIGPVGTKLVPSMRYGPDHYLNPQPRDFVEVLSR